MITISVSDRRATASGLVPLPTGNVQSIKVQLQIPDNDALWQNALIVAVFAAKTPKGSWIVCPGVIDEDGQTKIPGDVLRIAEAEVYVGIRGTFADNREITTNVAYLGKTVMGAGGEIVDTLIRDSELTQTTEFLAALYELVKSRPVIETVTNLPQNAEDGKIVYRNSASARGFYICNQHIWTQITDDTLLMQVMFLNSMAHNHPNKPSLDKLIVSPTYAALPQNASDGTVAFVTETDTETIWLDDAEERYRNKVPSFMPEIAYDANASEIDEMLVYVTIHDGEGLGYGISFLPIYADGEERGAFGALGMRFIATTDTDYGYMMLFFFGEGLDNVAVDDLLSDVELDDDTVETLLFAYSFDDFEGKLESGDGELPTTFSVHQGYNAVIISTDGENEHYGVYPIDNPTKYVDFGRIAQVGSGNPNEQWSTTEPILYRVVNAGTETLDKRGVYHRINNQWVLYYADVLGDLQGRVSILENGKPDDVTLLGFETYSNLVLRHDALRDEYISNVPVYVHGVGGEDICKLYAYAPGEEYEYPAPEPYDCIALTDIRDYATGMPCFVIRVMMGGTHYYYIPRQFTGTHGLMSSGWYTSGDVACDAPTITNFSPNRLMVGSTTYDDLSQLTNEAKSALRSLSQCINVSAAAMGTINVPDDAVLRFNGVIQNNRKYAFTTGFDCTFAMPSEPWSETDAQFVLYLNCTADVDLSFPNDVIFAGGTAPNSETGKHKLIGCVMPSDGTWAIGGVDYEAVT